MPRSESLRSRSPVSRSPVLLRVGRAISGYGKVPNLWARARSFQPPSERPFPEVLPFLATFNYLVLSFQ